MCQVLTHCGFSGVSLDGNCAYVHWGSFTSNSRSVRRAIWLTWFSEPHECIQHLAVTRRSPIMNRARRCLTSVIKPITMSERRIPYIIIIYLYCLRSHVLYILIVWDHTYYISVLSEITCIIYPYCLRSHVLYICIVWDHTYYISVLSEITPIIYLYSLRSHVLYICVVWDHMYYISVLSEITRNIYLCCLRSHILYILCIVWDHTYYISV